MDSEVLSQLMKTERMQCFNGNIVTASCSSELLEIHEIDVYRILVGGTLHDSEMGVISLLPTECQLITKESFWLSESININTVEATETAG